MRPPAVTTGFTFGKCEPVLVMPRAASSGTSPKGTCQRIPPELRSYAVRVVQGGAITERPLSANINPKPLLYCAAARSALPAWAGIGFAEACAEALTGSAK